MKNNDIKTLSDAREEKARMSGDYSAQARAFEVAKLNESLIRRWLAAHPEIGELISGYYIMTNGVMIREWTKDQGLDEAIEFDATSSEMWGVPQS